MRFHSWTATLLVVVGEAHAQDVGANAGALAKPIEEVRPTSTDRPAEPATLRPTTRDEAPRVFYDDPGDGNVWARGADYKASFGPEGATFVPFFGSRAPRNFPLSLSPDRVTVDGAPVELVRGTVATRDGDRVEMEHGTFVERYDVALRSVEQSFEFAALPRRGEIAVHIPVRTELEGCAAADGIEFSGAWGRVRYGGAVAFDGRGRRVAVETTLEDGGITLRVPSEFVASASLPLVIDPVVSTFVVDDPYLSVHSVDLCWDPNFYCWLAAYTEVFSASDNDVRARIVNADGTIRHSAYVDVTSANWIGPRCAGVAAAGQCLVVATRTGSPSSVVGREVGTLDAAMYPAITISRSQDGPAQNPVVGGTTLANGTANYVVAYERVYAPHDRDIFVRRVRADNTLVGSAPTNIGLTTTLDQFRPQISKSTSSGRLGIVWERNDGSGYVLMISTAYPTGSFSYPYLFTGVQSAHFNASVSSELGFTNTYAVAHEVPTGSGGTDIELKLAFGTGFSAGVGTNLSRAEGWDATSRRHQPSVEVLGDRVVVAYAHRVTAINDDIYCCEATLAPYTPSQVLQARVPLAQSTTDELRPSVTGLFVQGELDPGTYRDCVIAWDDGANGGRIEGAVFRGN